MVIWWALKSCRLASGQHRSFLIGWRKRRSAVGVPGTVQFVPEFLFPEFKFRKVGAPQRIRMQLEPASRVRTQESRRYDARLGPSREAKSRFF